MSFASPLDIWHCDEASGNLLDASGGNDMTAVNSPGATTGKLSGGRSFVAASSQYAYVNRSAHASWTMHAWFKCTNFGADRSILGWTNATGNQWSGIMFVTAGAKLAGYLYDTNFGGRTITGSTTLSSGTWYHGVWTVTSSGPMDLYLNGASDATTVNLSGPPFSSWSDGPRIWAANAVPGSYGIFNGELDELVYDNTVWTAGNVTSAYNGGSGATFPISAGGYTLTAAQGSFTLTGQAAALRAARLLTAAQGSHTLTGQAANLLAGRRLAAAQGSFALTGQSANLLAQRILAASQGAYALTGQDASLLAARKLTADHGAFTLTGQDAALLANRLMTLTAEMGSFGLTGQDVGLLAGRRLTAGQGSFSLSGQDAVLRAARRIAAGQGSITITGQSVTLTYSGGVVVIPVSIPTMDGFRIKARRRRLVG